MKEKKFIYFLIVATFVFFPRYFYSQTSIQVVDSLRSTLSLTDDTNRVNTLNDIAYEYTAEFPDSAIYYAEKALVLSEKLNFISGQIAAYNYLGLAEYYKNNYEKAIEYYNSVIELSRKSGNKLKEAIANNNIGLAYDDRADYKNALEYYLKGLSLVEKIGNKRLIANITNNVGLIYQNQGNYDKALEYHQYSLKLKQEIKSNPKMIANSLANIALTFKLKKEYDKSLEYNLKALDIRRSVDDKSGISLSLINIGSAYEAQEMFDKATRYFEEALDIKKQMPDRYGLALALLNVGFNKCNRKLYAEGFSVINEGLNVAKQIGAKDLISSSYEMLSYTYRQKKDFENAFKYQSLYITMKDSILNAESTKQINELQVKYEDVKKKSEILLLNKDKELQQVEIKRQTTRNYALMFGVVLLSILLLLIYKSYHDKKKANLILQKLNNEVSKQKQQIEEKNHELSQQNEEITAQRDEIEAQRDTVTNQKMQIEKIHKDLTDSINYAKKIQEAVLPKSEILENNNKEHFILYKPKSVVSGDFYWFFNQNNKLYITVADCTGHGVPGGFMSMLGISFLNEIISTNTEISAASMLNEMRRYIVNSLQQEDILSSAGTGKNNVKDGMDMALVIIDQAKNKIQFAGANNPLYVIARSEASKQSLSGKVKSPKGIASSRSIGIRDDEEELYELKGDKMPISIHVSMDEFTNQEIEVESGDMIYLFSDGYADQFGGEKNKKFMYKRFKELLTSVSSKPLDEQNTILSKTIEEWKNTGYTKEQTDDITVIGIKI